MIFSQQQINEIALISNAAFRIRGIRRPKTLRDITLFENLYNYSEFKTRCADKIQLRRVCKEYLGVDICPPILKIYESPNEISFNDLPDKFVLKCNHGSHTNIIVDDRSKISQDSAQYMMSRWLSEDYSLVGGEIHYHDIQRRCFAEEYIGDDLIEYKMLCIFGIPQFSLVVANRYGDQIVEQQYDSEFKLIDLYDIPNQSKDTPCFERPKQYEQMLEYAKKLSKDLSVARIDFDVSGNKLFLSEITLTPGIFPISDSGKEFEKKIVNLYNKRSQIFKL